MLKLLGVWLPHPLLGIMAFYATAKAFRIARKKFPDTHSSNGVGNAFRHAFWCCLILMYGCKISSPRKTLAFCKKITDLHEELFPNEPLETLMDLHNNKIGMDLFMTMLSGVHRQFFEKQFFIEKLMDKVKTAEILRSTDQNLGSELVYLEE
ncbi:DUF6973 domain-containing protein [Bergeyella sp. RCAD1439]|uniref:DUF6973 domain-containing protein n=1 Tax=Bergeyella anatis TaxID=3113737 RepID=UPI002E17393C|nr:hypothetical protein [Bergeyella sp. RCAD1439]